jgi:CBS domain-containing protein
MQSILVKDYMDHNPHSISVSTNVKDVVDRLLKDKIIGAPVVDGNKNLVGYVSEQDCIKEMLQDAFYCEEPGPVTSVMKTEVATVSPDMSIVEIAEAMLKKHHKNFPVVSNGKLVGLISRSNVLQALLEHENDCYIKH